MSNLHETVATTLPEGKSLAPAKHAGSSCKKEIPMNTNDLHPASISLHKGEIRHVQGKPGQRIEVLAGCLWITMDNDLRDIVINAGEGFRVDRGAETYISAFDDSRYLVLEPGVAPRH
jgi:Protein of unknown function (DUF2917)